MKRRLRYFLLILLTLIPVAHASDPVVLRLSWWGGNEVHRAMLESVRQFEKAHPDIEVRTEYTGWAGHLERITTQIAGGTAPDVMQINWNWLTLFSYNGKGFYDLRKLSDTIDLSQFDEDDLSMGTVKGRLNAVPTSMAARLFYFNATTYAKAGIPVPSSWDELIAAGPIFKQRLGDDYYPLDLTFQDFTTVARSWLVQRTGKPLIDENTGRLTVTVKDLADTARLYQQMVDQHVIPPARVRAAYGYVAQQELRPWITGHYAGAYQWITGVGKMIDTLDPGQKVVLGGYPMLPGTHDAGLMLRPAMLFAVNAHTEHPHEAALLVNFLLNDPAAVKAMGLRHGVPLSKSAVATLTADGQMQGLAVTSMAQVAALPHKVHENPYFEHARVRDAFIDGYELLGYGRITPDELGQRLYDDINRILARTVR